MSDIEACHRGHAIAVEACRDLEARIETCFSRLLQARHALMERADVDAVTNWGEAMGAAWKVWIARHETEGMAAAPRTEDEMRLERENAALALVAKASE